MKQLRLGAGVLLALLAAGLWLSLSQTRLYDSLRQELTQAAAQALEEDWSGARAAEDRAREQWQKGRHFAAAFLDHAPLEEMDSLFAELAIYNARQAPTEYAAVCTLLAQQAEAMGESHRLTWWNFL